jgi:hypothetical protein
MSYDVRTRNGWTPVPEDSTTLLRALDVMFAVEQTNQVILENPEGAIFYRRTPC